MLILQALYPLKSLPRIPWGSLPKGGLLSPASLLSAPCFQGNHSSFLVQMESHLPLKLCDCFDGLPAFCLSSLSGQLQLPQPTVIGWEPALDRGTMSLFSVCVVLNHHLTTALPLKHVYPRSHALWQATALASC